MAKGKTTKKKNLKLRRQLRKTFGCLFMISALIVTAIPVTPTKAASQFDTVNNHYVTSRTTTSNGGEIPYLDPTTTTVYQTADGIFQFAYVDENGSSTSAVSNKSAVIVGYKKAQTLSGGILTIPDTVDAYVKYADEGSTGGFAAANKLGKPLYYKVMETYWVNETTMEEYQEDGTWASGTVVVKKERFSKFQACTEETKSTWCPDGTDIELYYFNGTVSPLYDDLRDESKWSMVGTAQNDGRIKNARVDYIGNQMAVFDESTNDWKIGADSSKVESVFGGEGDDTHDAKVASNITTLIIGENLKGVGDYAFYNCFNIESITFSNGLSTLGNYAFANCGNLVSAEMPFNARIATLGDHAFYNCGNLQSFAMPTFTQAIGDSCFENCTSLKKIDLIRKDAASSTEEEILKNSNLKQIGYLAFKNCASLESLTFPKSYEGADASSNNVFHLSTVDGCTSLKYISTQSSNIDFVSESSVDGDYNFEQFKANVGDEFYIEGPGYLNEITKEKTKIHNTANIQHIAFKYYGEDKYEIVESSKDVTGTTVGLVYAVNSAGELIEFRVEDPATGNTLKVKVPEVNMPEKIGPYGIVTIAEGSFNDNCWIEKVTIPASVQYIMDNAFKGSHNLKHVIFTDAKNIESIGTNAFATQQIKTSAPAHSEGGQDGNSCKDDSFLSEEPVLTFSGAIEKDDGTNTVPFKFAMKSTSKINEGRQPLTYITYYSGFPTNLTVKYNPDTQMSELQDFPRKADVTSGYVNPDYDSATDPISDKYLYPYITDEISTEAVAAYPSGATENQTNMRNAVENIVIPNGVQSVKTGLFSGVDEEGLLLEDAYDESGVQVGEAGKLPTLDWAYPESQEIKSITVKSVSEIEPYTFARMKALEKAYVSGATTIGDYAFDSCPALTMAEIGADTTELGLRPFSGCETLTEVNFPESTSFAYENGIIYGLTDGAKTSIVECLEGRGTIVGNRAVGVEDDFSSIKTISPEAFMDCDSIRTVDLSKSSITTVPVRCFAEDDLLNSVILPNTIRMIEEGSFWNTTTLGSVTIPESISYIKDFAFHFVDKDEYGNYEEPDPAHSHDGTRTGFDFITTADSNAALYAEGYDYIGVTQDASLKATYSVMLFDAVDPENPVFIKEYQVRDGENLELTILDVPDHEKEGYQFLKWWPSADIFNPIVADTEIWAMYEEIGATTYTVRFYDINGEEMTEYTQQVVEGGKATPPSKDEMEVEGKVFTGWDRDYTNISRDLDLYAQYSDRTAGKYYVTFWTDMDMSTMIGKVQEVSEGESALEPAHPTKEGYTFANWSSDAWKSVTKDLDIFAVYTSDDENGENSDNDDGTGTGSGSGGSSSGSSSGSDSSSSSSTSDNSVSGNGVKYKVTVNGGSGSGEYTAGTIVPINAYARADGTVFSKWTSSSDGVGFVNQTAISTTFTMPANNVVIDANFKVGSSSSVSGNSRSARRNSTTTVDITKGGISNTDKASANVNGSSDNYVIKITEDAEATAAVIAALEAKYGDLSNIAYLPMDISLYDSTGTKKITDVSGITVDITLPLPDDLIQYAGNNRAASVVNGQLEELNAKFTTIDGVPCVQFTATHFSPYTIYVDKANLTEGTIDATPKTGDPIHPKWFLAMGLACISIVLFCKKDRQPNLTKA